jgi:hypothetical protein
LRVLVEDGPGGLPEEPPVVEEACGAEGAETVTECRVDGEERRLHILRIPV